MSKTKLKLILDSCAPQEIRDVKIDEVLQAIKFSPNCLLVYSKDGEIEVLFSGFTEDLLNDLIVGLCTHEDLFKFLKLSVIVSEKIKKNNKKGMDFAKIAAAYIKKNFGNT